MMCADGVKADTRTDMQLHSSSDLGASGQACLCASKGLLRPRPYCDGFSSAESAPEYRHHTPSLIVKLEVSALPCLRCIQNAQDNGLSGQRSLALHKLWMLHLYGCSLQEECGGSPRSVQVYSYG
jgi:hypothetical protein